MKNVPKLRFPGYTEEWEQHSLSDYLFLSNDKNDGSFSRDDILAASLGTELTKKHIYFGLRATDESVKTYKVVKPNDVIYTKSPIKGFPNGIIRTNKGEAGIVPTLYCVYHSVDGINPSFIQAFFEDKGRLDRYLTPLVNIGARNNVNITDKQFLEGMIIVPNDINEQNEIVETIEEISLMIQLQQQEVNALEKQKTAIIGKIFSQKMRFKRTDGRYFPDWHRCYLRDVFVERNETSVITEDYPLLSFTIEDGVIDPKDKKTNKRDYLMKDKETKKFKKTELDDIIYNPSNMKYGAIHRNKLMKGLVSPIYAIFRSKFNPIYMEYLVSNPDFIMRSQKYLEGTVVKLRTLKPEDFLRMEVLISSDIEEQRLIADFLSDFDEAIAAAKKELELWKELKKGLLQQMFV